jgi:hypothetical protein
MKFEISLIEVQEFLVSCYDKKVGLKYIKEDTIEVNYFATIVLTIKEVIDNQVVFQYQVNGLVELLAKIIVGNKLADSPIEWDSKNNEVIFYLNKVDALSHFLMTNSISTVSFLNENIVLVLDAKSKNKNQ